MYALTQGATEVQIIEMAFRDRRALPDAIQNAPELILGLEFAWNAYWDLCSCRDYGFGSGPIPWTAILDYCRAHELDSDDREDFIYLIRAMDKAHLGYIDAEREKKNNRGGK